MGKQLIFLILGLVLVSCHNSKQKPTSVLNSKQTITHDTVINLFGTGTLEKYNLFPSAYITPRSVSVWLPKTYSAKKQYSVIYMHDGQMLFDSTTTWNKQEWKVDEWGTKLKDKVNDFIVVGIDNIPEVRWQDLFPEKAYDYILDTDKAVLEEEKKVALNGDNYLKFIVEELKPVIDSNYSVKTNKQNTFVMGSSMGGLMSMYALCEYPNVFGGAACISTHWVGAMPMDNNPYPEAIFKYMNTHLPKDSHKIYFDYGNKTLDAHYPQYAEQVNNILANKGYTSDNAVNIFFEGADHSENSWNKRLDKPLLFLLKK